MLSVGELGSPLLSDVRVEHALANIGSLIASFLLVWIDDAPDGQSVTGLLRLIALRHRESIAPLTSLSLVALAQNSND